MFVPALLTSTDNGAPSASSSAAASSTSASLPCRHATSACTAATPSGSALKPSAERAHATTRAPSAASSCTQARPMPLVPPVTRQPWPRSEKRPAIPAGQPSGKEVELKMKAKLGKLVGGRGGARQQLPQQRYTMKALVGAPLLLLLLPAPASSGPANRSTALGIVNATADCGVDSTGAADVTAALQACIERAYRANRALFLPPGRYLVSDTLCAALALPDRPCPCPCRCPCRCRCRSPWPWPWPWPWPCPSCPWPWP
eukprot:COSAG04_NODE_663_length_11444_cov_4.242045_3_plen_258_part_00